MLETVWIKHVSLPDFKNNKTYHSDMTLVVAEELWFLLMICFFVSKESGKELDK